ncbi:unnamed protein product [Pleuronectes platessa]|uniref:Uncharacterized protein n=1 Tax=Pleuronectes platessa TaxID=8262 RepID=A0A9N7UTC7_PLEPL|nr:unnamed protein product [Pleuronectes platessa]
MMFGGGSGPCAERRVREEGTSDHKGDIMTPPPDRLYRENTTLKSFGKQPKSVRFTLRMSHVERVSELFVDGVVAPEAAPVVPLLPEFFQEIKDG